MQTSFTEGWSDMNIDMNTVEAALFEACTTLVLGDGKSTSLERPMVARKQTQGNSTGSVQAGVVQEPHSGVRL
jgi:hypothetical protein